MNLALQIAHPEMAERYATSLRQEDREFMLGMAWVGHRDPSLKTKGIHNMGIYQGCSVRGSVKNSGSQTFTHFIEPSKCRLLAI